MELTMKTTKKLENMNTIDSINEQQEEGKGKINNKKAQID